MKLVIHIISQSGDRSASEKKIIFDLILKENSYRQVVERTYYLVHYSFLYTTKNNYLHVY